MEAFGFSISLSDKMSGPAATASKQVATLTEELEKNKKALAANQAQLSLAKEIGDVASYRRYSLAVGEHRQNVFALSQQLEELGPAAAAAESSMAGFAGAALAAAGVAAGLALALGHLAVEGAMFAIEASQSKQAMLSMYDAMLSTEGAGVKVDDMLSDLSARIGITKDELGAFTQRFAAMGVTSVDALEHMTRAAVSAQAILNDPKAATAFEHLEKKIQAASLAGVGLKMPEKGLASLASMGVSVVDVATEMGISAHALAAQLKAGTVHAESFGVALENAIIKKGEGPLARMGSSLGNMRKMFGQSIEDMFEDMSTAVDPFLSQLKGMLNIFTQSVPSGQAMKWAITGAFTEIFSIASKVVPYIKHFFLYIVIYSLEAYLFVKQHWGAVKTTLMGVAVVLGLVAAAAAVTAAAAAVMVAPFIAAGAAVFYLVGAAASLIDELFKLSGDSEAAGKSVGEGFVRGIESSAPATIKAASGIGAAAEYGLRDSLAMQSPSRVMMELGTYTSEGFAKGVDGGARSAAAASRRLSSEVTGAIEAPAPRRLMADVRPDYVEPDAARHGGRDAPGEGASVAISGPIQITIHAPDGVTDAGSLTEIAIASLFERLALMQGR